MKITACLLVVALCVGAHAQSGSWSYTTSTPSPMDDKKIAHLSEDSVATFSDENGNQVHGQLVVDCDPNGIHQARFSSSAKLDPSLVQTTTARFRLDGDDATLPMSLDILRGGNAFLIPYGTDRAASHFYRHTMLTVELYIVGQPVQFVQFALAGFSASATVNSCPLP